MCVCNHLQFHICIHVLVSLSFNKYLLCNETVIDPLLHKYLTNKSYKEATNPDRVAVLSPDMKRVRAKQQEVTIQRSIEAAEERKRKLAEEREKKRVMTPEEERWEKLGGEGTRLGDSSAARDDAGEPVGLRRRGR